MISKESHSRKEEPSLKGIFSGEPVESSSQERDNFHLGLRRLSDPDLDVEGIVREDYETARWLISSFLGRKNREKQGKSKQLPDDTGDLIYQAGENCRNVLGGTATRIALMILRDEVSGRGSSSAMLGRQLDEETGKITTREAARYVRKNALECIFDREPGDLIRLGVNPELVVCAYELTLEDIRKGDIAGSPRAQQTIDEMDRIRPFWDYTEFGEEDNEVSERFQDAREGLVEIDSKLQDLQNRSRSPFRRFLSRLG